IARSMTYRIDRPITASSARAYTRNKRIAPGISRIRSTIAGSSHADGAGARRGVSPADASGRTWQVQPDWFVYFVPVSDLPLTLPAGLASMLLAALDQERKIDRALAALGPVAHRDVAVIGGGAAELERPRAGGGRVLALTPRHGGRGAA